MQSNNANSDLKPEINIYGAGVCQDAVPEILLPQQTHSCNVAIVTEADLSDIAAGRVKPESRFADTDALITRLPDLYIGVRTADCVPILIYSPDIAAVAAVHAGWKGTLLDIAGKTVRKLQLMGANPKLAKVLIAPCICADCYEVNRDLAGKFIAAGLVCGIVCCNGDAKPHIDLRHCNVMRLVNAGIPEANISVSAECTRHTRDKQGAYEFYSYRRTPGEICRNISAIRLSTTGIADEIFADL